MVTGLGGSVTLSLTEGAYVLTWAGPDLSGGSVGGALAIDGARLDLLEAGATAPESVHFHLAPGTLALSSDASAWAFDGDVEEPADFVAVLVRL